MYDVHIDDLSKPVRTAVVTSIRSKDRTLAFGQRSGGLVLLVFAGLAVLAFLVFRRYGDVEASRQPSWVLLIYGAAFASIAIGLIYGAVDGRTRRKLGFPPGIYVVGGHLVDARTPVLGITPIHDVEPRLVDMYRKGMYQHTLVDLGAGRPFVFPSRGAAQSAVARFDAKRSLIAAAASDDATLFKLDPVRRGLAEQARLVDIPARPAVMGWRAPAVAVVATVALTPAAYFYRNARSVEAAFADAATPEAVDRWVSGGGDRARGEARKLAMVFDAAIASGSAKKLREVLRVHAGAPAHLITSARASLSARYAAAAAAADAVPAGDELRWFVNETYAYLVQGGEPYVAVLVSDVDTSELRELDDKRGTRGVAVAEHFTFGDNRLRVAGVEQLARKSLARFFPEDVATVVGTSPAHPQLELTHAIAVVRDGDRVRRYAVPAKLGAPVVELRATGTLRVPGRGEPRTRTFSSSPTLTLAFDPGRGDPATQLYAAVAKIAFADVEGQIVRWLNKPTEPRPAR